MPMSVSTKHQETLEKNIQAVEAISAIVADTLGPDGLDLMLVDEFGHSFCTNDGVAILNNMQIKNPIAKYVKDAAVAQEEQVGDGTTSVCVMLRALVQESLETLKTKNLSPVALAKKLQKAKTQIIEIIKANSKQVSGLDDANLLFASFVASRADEEISKFVTELYKKSFENYHDEIFDLSDHIYTYKNQEERIIKGLLLKKKAHLNPQTTITEAKLLMIKGALEPQPISSEAANTDEGVKKFTNNIQEVIEVCKKIKRKGIKAVFCSGSIFQQAEEFLNKEDILVISHLSQDQFNNIQKLSKAKTLTRSELFDQDQNIFEDRVGDFDSITWDEKLRAFIIQGPKFNFHTLLLSQNTQSLLDEKLRVAQDTAKVFKATMVEGFSEGGGIAEMLAFDSYREQNPDEDVLDIVEQGLSSIFMQIQENSSSTESFQELRQKYKKDQVIDATKVKTSVVDIAFDLCSQIVKVKNIVVAK